MIKRRMPLPTPLGVLTDDCGSEGGLDSLVNISDSVDSSREGTSSLINRLSEQRGRTDASTDAMPAARYSCVL